MNPLGEPDFTAHDYIIGGKLVVGKVTMDESFAALVKTDPEARMELKRKLIHDMAAYMLENNLVEFTQTTDPLSFRTAVMVRAYLAPNDQVKILRLANKIV